MKKSYLGHLMAIITIIIWGTTFISTKILLEQFSAEEILAYRFSTAFVILILIYPKNIRILTIKEEMLFCLLGITGISFYYWTENLALKYTYASNVALIVSAIPIFTALMAHFTNKDEKLTANLLLGFLVAMVGIVIVIYNGEVLKLNSIGDFIAMLSAILFSIYSILIKRVSNKYNQFFIVRKIFFYGILTMTPILFLSNVRLFQGLHLNIKIILNMLFLSVFASILCFIMWNKSISIIGSVKTTNYIYIVPLITIVSSVIILKEKVDLLMVFGGFLILSGVYINESKWIGNRLRLLFCCKNLIIRRKEK
ncbi:DMT family transporter [Clostridium sp. WILCCON 0269]|uniref:DMT family transporter n=1 Tax=Candidatus Clostridium eludens TaxID=3381663 RepID=A0ABW8SNS3_9CLOT